jgi:hypothetical protein
MMIARMALLTVFLLFAAEAKTFKTSLAWSALPSDLVGRKVKVEIAKGRPQSGVVEKVDASGIALRRRKGGSRVIARADVSALEWTTRKPPKWSIIGAAAGAAHGIFLTSVAVILDRNEGGIYGARNIGVAAGILAGGALAGALIGWSDDVNRHVVTITGP